MMRYLKYLADKDYALDRGMIPLGSCTMKLNAATEMEAVTWPEFAGIHPFAPEADVEGYLALIEQLESWLAEVTGYDSVSLQPNAGSQGELAGLLAIRGYHRANGDAQRTVCLIPSSAHGTNAAQRGARRHEGRRRRLRRARQRRPRRPARQDRRARRRPRRADDHLPVDARRLRARGRARSRRPCTTPADRSTSTAPTSTRCSATPASATSAATSRTSTCTRPSASRTAAADPASARSRRRRTSRRSCPATRSPSAATTRIDAHDGGPHLGRAYGSPSILPISWAYVRMMGAEGLKQATGAAVLAANYVAARLREHYPVLYSGDNGLVAHECILDLRPLTAATGVTVDDVAKRLIDYGFHAPTMSFPVAGTLMVEPTESEDLAEIDRFIDAMIAIKVEADAVAARRLAGRRQPAAQRAAHGAVGHRGGVDAPVHAREGRLPGALAHPRASTGRRCAASTRPTATATWSAPARRSRPSRSSPSLAELRPKAATEARKQL